MKKLNRSALIFPVRVIPISNEDQEEAIDREDLNLNKIGGCCSALECELEQLSTDSRINLADCAEKARAKSDLPRDNEVPSTVNRHSPEAKRLSIDMVSDAFTPRDAMKKMKE